MDYLISYEYNRMFDCIISNVQNSINSCTRIRGSDPYSISGYMNTYLPKMMKGEQDAFSSRLNQAFVPIHNIMNEYCIENRELFEKYSINLSRSKDDIVYEGRIEDFHRDLGKVSYNDSTGNTAQQVFVVAGWLTGAAVGLPLAVVDGLLGTDMSTTVIEVTDGIINGFLNFFSDLSVKKRDAISSATCSVNMIRNKHKAEFLSLAKEQMDSTLHSMTEISNNFSEEYKHIYMERKREVDKEKQKIENEINKKRRIHEQLNTYLYKLKTERTT